MLAGELHNTFTLFFYLSRALTDYETVIWNYVNVDKKTDKRLALLVLDVFFFFLSGLTGMYVWYHIC